MSSRHRAGSVPKLFGDLPDEAHAQSPHCDDRDDSHQHGDRIEGEHGHTVTPQQANHGRGPRRRSQARRRPSQWHVRIPSRGYDSSVTESYDDGTIVCGTRPPGDPLLLLPVRYQSVPYTQIKGLQRIADQGPLVRQVALVGNEQPALLGQCSSRSTTPGWPARAA